MGVHILLPSSHPRACKISQISFLELAIVMFLRPSLAQLTIFSPSGPVVCITFAKLPPILVSDLGKGSSLQRPRLISG